MGIALGLLAGLALGGGFGALIGVLTGLDVAETLIIAGVCGGVAAIHSAIAFHLRIYRAGFASVLGYVLDVTWSLLNTFAGLAVWIPACLIVGGKLKARDGNSQRSGCFVFDKNPRGAGWDTTIGTVVAGHWSAHEEIHVWQARLFGPLYLISYGLGLVLNMLFRLLTFRVSNLGVEAYHRVCYEDWGYWAGSSSGASIKWGMWMLGFLLTAVYVGLLVMIPVGIGLADLAVGLTGGIGLTLYSVVRAIAPAGH